MLDDGVCQNLHNQDGRTNFITISAWNLFILQTFGKEEPGHDYAYALQTGDFSNNILAPEKLCNPFKLILSIIVRLNLFLVEILAWFSQRMSLVRLFIIARRIRIIFALIGVLIILVIVASLPTLPTSPILVAMCAFLTLIGNSIFTTDILFKIANPFNQIINPLAQWIAKKHSLSRNISLALASFGTIMLGLAVCIIMWLPANLAMLACIFACLLIKLATWDWAHWWQDIVQICSALGCIKLKMLLAAPLKAVGGFLLVILKITLNSKFLIMILVGLSIAATALVSGLWSIIPQSIKAACSSTASAVFTDSPALINFIHILDNCQSLFTSYMVVVWMIPLKTYIDELGIIQRLLYSELNDHTQNMELAKLLFNKDLSTAQAQTSNNRALNPDDDSNELFLIHSQ